MTTTGVTLPSGGFAKRIWYATQDSAGYLESNNGTAPTAGNQTGAPMLQVMGLQDFPFAAADPQTPSQRGNQGALARFIYPAAELPSSTFTTGASNYTLEALAESTSVATYGGGKFIGRQPSEITFKDLLLLVTSDAKSIESGNAGSMWEARFIFYANMFSKGRNSFNDSSVPTYDHTVTANPSAYLPFGVSCSTAFGVTSVPYTDFTWPYEPHMERWTGDGSETTFNITQNVAEDSSDNVYVTVNGTAVTWVTGVPSAGEFGITDGTPDTIVFGTAPAHAAKVTMLLGIS